MPDRGGGRECGLRLGELQATEAIRSLFRVLLQSAKRDIAAMAVGALVKIGEPAVVPLLDVLVDTIQKALLRTAVKLMDDGQVTAVKKAVDAEGDSLIKKEHLQAAMLLGDCRRDVSCYLARIEHAGLQTRDHPFVAIKAAHMLGGLGNDGTRGEIAKRLPRIANDAIRFEALNAIDHLSPSGDRKTADDLRAILDEQMTRGEAPPVDPAMRQIIARLRARAA